MTAPTTATVETLVAEVRVLMVGSRQITLSVAKQLDLVEIQDLTPFGRIRLDSNDWPAAPRPSGHVIGCAADGSLCRALAYAGQVNLPVVSRSFGQGALVACCQYHLPSSRRMPSQRGTGVYYPITWNASEVLVYAANVAVGESRCNAQALQLNTSKALTDEIVAATSLFHAAETVYQAARSAPLIVLAGLR